MRKFIQKSEKEKKRDAKSREQRRIERAQRKMTIDAKLKENREKYKEYTRLKRELEIGKYENLDEVSEIAR